MPFPVVSVVFGVTLYLLNGLHSLKTDGRKLADDLLVNLLRSREHLLLLDEVVHEFISPVNDHLVCVFASRVLPSSYSESNSIEDSTVMIEVITSHFLVLSKLSSLLLRI